MRLSGRSLPAGTSSPHGRQIHVSLHDRQDLQGQWRRLQKQALYSVPQWSEVLQRLQQRQRQQRQQREGAKRALSRGESDTFATGDDHAFIDNDEVAPPRSSQTTKNQLGRVGVGRRRGAAAGGSPRTSPSAARRPGGTANSRAETTTTTRKRTTTTTRRDDEDGDYVHGDE